MDSYIPLLEKTRVPQPSLQKFAVVSIFTKLRSAPAYLNPESDPGRDAISQCLHSSSPAVVDQTVRELCRLVSDSKLEVSRGLLELQSALEGADSKFVGLFVKGLGFLIRIGFQRNHGSWRLGSPVNHPFVKILSCRTEVQSELVQQVLLFVAQNRQLEMAQVCEFLRPFLNFSILRIPISSSSSSLFARHLISSMASFCCSFPNEAIPILKLLMGCLKYLPHRNSDELRDSYCFLECIVDAYSVVLRHLVRIGLLVAEAQLFSVELSETILSLLTCLPGHSAGAEPIVDLVKGLFVIQKDLTLCYIRELSSTVLCLFIILIQSDLEHEQLSLLRFIIFLLKWKSENGPIFTVSFLFVNFASSDKTDAKGMYNQARSWASQLREYSLRIIDRRKSSPSLSQSEETFLKEMPPLLSAITGVLVMHQSLGNIAIDLLATIGAMDPKLGVPLLLAILFYCNIFTRNDINYQDMLPKLLALLPSLASHFLMIPLIIQTILPMLQKDGPSVLYATGARLLWQTWAINDRAFGSLQTVLLPKGFTEFKSDRNICVSLATSIRDVCKKNPDRGVDIILSVSACIESKDPIIQALGLQSLAHLCEADVIEMEASTCLLLRWGALDAEAYPEASKNVLRILWHVGASKHVSHVVQWAKTRAAAFQALSQYEVSHIEKGISDFKRENMELLLSESDIDVLKAMEGFQVKIITHEHMNRRRLVKERKVTGSKIEKLLDVLPQVLFPSDKKSNAGKLPGAALLCISFTPKDANSLGISRALDVHVAYENALVEIASSFQLSRNIFVALLSLQSWKTFMRRWMRASLLSLDAKAPSVVLDKTSKAANNILRIMMRLAEESIPRSAENIALAVGALCVVLPPSAHTIKSTASKFLLNWLFQYEHEHRQWSSAISLGLISSCLHVTDHKQKFQNVTGLIEVLCGSKSTLVKGACGVGLGFSCQDLLARVETADSNDLDEKTTRYRSLLC
ncbi:hypothetical protein GH714_009909 [Hevea brasiliensis]|uniref:DUF3730 domain-containing protein n=1 Tax=Hevea brasiliensis TaxID=3981 RepID=A0A6A6M7V0_HEVBR|nr:hypothetical protein GH714_009909 [Hevea brasiliensis]